MRNCAEIINYLDNIAVAKCAVMHNYALSSKVLGHKIDTQAKRKHTNFLFLVKFVCFRFDVLFNILVRIFRFCACTASEPERWNAKNAKFLKKC